MIKFWSKLIPSLQMGWSARGYKTVILLGEEAVDMCHSVKLSKVVRSQSSRQFWKKKLGGLSGEIMVSPLKDYHQGAPATLLQKYKLSPNCFYTDCFLHCFQNCKCVQQSTAQRMSVCCIYVKYKHKCCLWPDEEQTREIKLSWPIFTPVQKHNDMDRKLTI